MFNDGHYVQILTASNPNGAIRGQILTIEKYPTVCVCVCVCVCVTFIGYL